MTQQNGQTDVLQERLNQLEITFKRERDELSETFKRQVFTSAVQTEDFFKGFETKLDALYVQHHERVRALYRSLNIPLLQYRQQSLDEKDATSIVFHDLNATPDHREEATIRKQDGALILDTHYRATFPDTKEFSPRHFLNFNKTSEEKRNRQEKRETRTFERKETE